MSKNATKKLVAKVTKMRKQGLSFRTIEAKFPATLGAGNGTKAYRLMGGKPATTPFWASTMTVGRVGA